MSFADFHGGGVGRGGAGEKLGIKLKLSFRWGLGLAELGKNAPARTNMWARILTDGQNYWTAPLLYWQPK